MRMKLAALAACVVMMGAGALWAEEAAATKEVTLKGTLQCAKCAMHETKTCQNVLKVKDGDKDVLYYLDVNDVSDAYHPKVCKAPKDDVSVTGTVSEKDGKKTIAATKVE